MKFDNYYIDMKTLSKMEKFEREMYLYMYKQLIEYMLNPADLSDFPSNQIEICPQVMCINHLCKCLVEDRILVDIRELNINKIID